MFSQQIHRHTLLKAKAEADERVQAVLKAPAYTRSVICGTSEPAWETGQEESRDFCTVEWASEQIGQEMLPSSSPVRGDGQTPGSSPRLGLVELRVTCPKASLNHPWDDTVPVPPLTRALLQLQKGISRWSASFSILRGRWTQEAVPPRSTPRLTPVPSTAPVPRWQSSAGARPLAAARTGKPLPVL